MTSHYDNDYNTVMNTHTPQPSADKLLRRQRILDAARRVYAAEGGISAGLRPIASAAGCTTGAIYSVFSGKEDIYAALLEESLRELAAMVAAAAGREADPSAALRASSQAFFDYYQTHTFEYSLGMYLFEHDGRKGLGPERDSMLNSVLAETLTVFKACFERLGADENSDRANSVALANSLFAGLLGVMAMATSGRDRSIGTTAEDVLATIQDMHICNAVTETGSR